MTASHRWVLALGVVLVANVGCLLVLASHGDRRLITVVAAAFAAILVGAALALNVATRAAGRSSLLVQATNSRLMSLAYCWGGLSMQGLYFTPLTGLRWQHGWQYALGLLLLASGAWSYADALTWSHPDRQRSMLQLTLPLAIGQAIAGGIGLTYLTISGKMLTERPDWAANQVFFFVALLATMLGALTIRSHVHLNRRDEPPH